MADSALFCFPVTTRPPGAPVASPGPSEATGVVSPLTGGLDPAPKQPGRLKRVGRHRSRVAEATAQVQPAGGDGRGGSGGAAPARGARQRRKSVPAAAPNLAASVVVQSGDPQGGPGSPADGGGCGTSGEGGNGGGGGARAHLAAEPQPIAGPAQPPNPESTETGPAKRTRTDAAVEGARPRKRTKAHRAPAAAAAKAPGKREVRPRGKSRKRAKPLGEEGAVTPASPPPPPPHTPHHTTHPPHPPTHPHTRLWLRSEI